jgi:hypothetical protein
MIFPTLDLSMFIMNRESESKAEAREIRPSSKNIKNREVECKNDHRDFLHG